MNEPEVDLWEGFDPEEEWGPMSLGWDLEPEYDWVDYE